MKDKEDIPYTTPSGELRDGVFRGDDASEKAKEITAEVRSGRINDALITEIQKHIAKQERESGTHDGSEAFGNLIWGYGKMVERLGINPLAAARGLNFILSRLYPNTPQFTEEFTFAVNALGSAILTAQNPTQAKQAMDVFTLPIDNERYIAELKTRYGEKFPVVENLVRAYEAFTERFKNKENFTPYHRAQWLNAILRNLQTHAQNITSRLEDEIENFITFMGTAEKYGDVGRTIDIFVKTKLVIY